jgi:hypothetical protein
MSEPRSPRNFTRDVVSAARPDVAIAYGFFIALALVPGLVADGGGFDVRVTLADLLGGHVAPSNATGGSGTGLLLVLLAAATIVVPALWKHRFAALAAVVPLLVTALGLWPLHRQHQAEVEAINALAEFGIDPQELVRQVDVGVSGPLGHLSIFAWLLFATVIYLAIRGVMGAVAAPAQQR